MNKLSTGTHLLSKHGIMSSFSIAKKLSDAKIKKIAEQSKLDEGSKEFHDHLKKQILRDTQLALYNNKIPGLISNEKVKKPTVVKKSENTNATAKKQSSLDEKKKARLALFATLIVQKILEQKSTTEEKCFLIVQIVNGLGLKDSDFKNFHTKSDPDDDDMDDEDDDDDDDDI
jgi:hypothetical protein